MDDTLVITQHLSGNNIKKAGMISLNDEMKIKNPGVTPLKFPYAWLLQSLYRRLKQ